MAPKKLADPDQYLEDVLVFVDRNGYIVSKDSNPMSCSLHMEYDKSDLKVKMNAYSHCQGNGSCNATVTYKGKVVYQANGSFTSRPYNSAVTKYVPGAWEELMKLS